MSGKKASHCWARRGGNAGHARDDRCRGRVTDLISGAEHTVFVSSLVITDAEIIKLMERKSRDGVRFYLFTATQARIAHDSGMEFPRSERGACNGALERLSKHALIRSSLGTHAKVVLADPLHDPRGLLLTMDVTAGCLDGGRGMAVDLGRSEAINANDIMRYLFWECAESEMIRPGGAVKCRPLGAARQAGGRALLQTAPGITTIRDGIDRLLGRNPSKVVVANPLWDPKSPVIGRLCSMSEKGADVTVITRKGGAMFPLAKMQDAGIRVAGFEKLHARAVSTEYEAIVMSSNMDRNGMEEGLELGIRLYKDRAREIADRLGEWAGAPEFELVPE